MVTTCDCFLSNQLLSLRILNCPSKIRGCSSNLKSKNDGVFETRCRTVMFSFQFERKDQLPVVHLHPRIYPTGEESGIQQLIIGSR